MFAIPLLAALAIAQLPEQAESLRNHEAVAVAIALGGETEALSIQQDSVTAFIEAKLRAAGIDLRKNVQAGATMLLTVRVEVMNVAGVVQFFVVQLCGHQFAVLPTPKTALFVTSWSSYQYGTAGEQKGATVRAALDKLLDEFLADWKKAHSQAPAMDPFKQSEPETAPKRRT